MKKFFALFSSFLMGSVVTFVIVNTLLTDQLGRKDQALFTLFRIFKDNHIVITRDQVAEAVENLYPIEDVIQRKGSILVHKIEFVFIDGKLSEIKGT